MRTHRLRNVLKSYQVRNPDPKHRAEMLEQHRSRIRAMEGIEWTEENEKQFYFDRKADLMRRIHGYIKYRDGVSWEGIFDNVPNHYKTPRSMQHSLRTEIAVDGLSYIPLRARRRA